LRRSAAEDKKKTESKKMKNLNLPWRQIHLDFHTSELIEGVGKDFDPDEFAETLVKAHVGQVCCFARCHHGMIYFDSKVHPERVHPHLARKNLLAEQIEACHKRGIRVPIYTSIQWDYYSAKNHPEWLEVSDDGSHTGTKAFEPGFYMDLCVNTPYRDFLKEHVKDIFASMPAVDGFFFDIVFAHRCVCRYCIEKAKARGIDPTDKDAMTKFGDDKIAEFMADMSAHVRGFKKDCSIYYNTGDLGPNHRDTLGSYTHMEFDALPSGHPEGYKGLRIRGRFERLLGVDCVAQTGKFHKMWGDFHSFKNPAALEYECFGAMSLNCKSLVGDQLLPSGRLEKDVYELIGGVYRRMEEKEPWCLGAKAVTDIGVLYSVKDTMKGATGMLSEGGHQFDVLDNDMDIAPYKVIIVTDTVAGDEKLSAKLDAYVAKGGKILAAFEGGMDKERQEFLPMCWPVKVADEGPIYRDGQPVRGRELGNHEYADYIVPSGAIGAGLPKTEHVMYAKGVEVAAVKGAHVLAKVTEPLFYRTWEHFCSHYQAPSSGKESYPAIVRKGDVIYFGHPVFSIYHVHGPRWVKLMVLNALKLLLPEPLLRHDGPTTLETTVNVQVDKKRWVVHMLHYIPLNRAKNLCTIEDVIPLYNVRVSLRADVRPRSMTCVPGGGKLDFAIKDGRMEFVVPKVSGHQMVEISYKP
jgi:hypothetical protein